MKKARRAVHRGQDLRWRGLRFHSSRIFKCGTRLRIAFNYYAFIYARLLETTKKTDIVTVFFFLSPFFTRYQRDYYRSDCDVSKVEVKLQNLWTKQYRVTLVYPSRSIHARQKRNMKKQTLTAHPGRLDCEEAISCSMSQISFNVPPAWKFGFVRSMSHQVSRREERGRAETVEVKRNGFFVLPSRQLHNSIIYSQYPGVELPKVSRAEPTCPRQNMRKTSF
ncbi:hypothetical protein PUN28_017312 [Cardiocondyla obscurior]|uniref:Ribosomal protein S10 n=1 Tax=Cardiocondyla obscurior TaxID=286306 RepID=A0AAW2ENE7_9HYME